LDALRFWHTVGFPQVDTTLARLIKAFTSVKAEGLGGGGIAITMRLRLEFSCTGARCAIQASNKTPLPFVHVVLPKLLFSTTSFISSTTTLTTYTTQKPS
jgi:hypothetical protein